MFPVCTLYIQSIRYIEYIVSPFHFALFPSVSFKFLVFRSIYVYLVLFKQSLVPQKGPHAIHTVYSIFRMELDRVGAKGAHGVFRFPGFIYFKLTNSTGAIPIRFWGLFSEVFRITVAASERAKLPQPPFRRMCSTDSDSVWQLSWLSFFFDR